MDPVGYIMSCAHRFTRQCEQNQPDPASSKISAFRWHAVDRQNPAPVDVVHINQIRQIIYGGLFI